MNDSKAEYEVFERHFQDGKTQLVMRWLTSDLETPVSAYLKICKHDSYSFLLESVEGGAALGRYSVIGTQPDLLWRCMPGGRVDVATGEDMDWKEKKEQTSVKQKIKDVIQQSSIDTVPDDLPPMCAWGMFGYIGYDMVRCIEDIPDQNPDDLGIPDSVLMRPTILVVFDHITNRMCLATPVYQHALNTDLDVKTFYQNAQKRIDAIIARIQSPLNRSLLECHSALSGDQDIVSNVTKEQYKKNVLRAVEYIRAGDIFQVVPSQRFSVDFDVPSFELYRSLRSINPSPFLFHLTFEGFSLVGSSPEILVRLRDNTVTIRPIAGTRKRGKTPQEDQDLADDLLHDAKECAEHLMLLDLGRNDVGRVAEIGSVTVTEQFQIELYSHVMHIVSNVEGVLRSDLDVVDALFAGFPAGTVSGAPKIRAMEIIDELETSRRGSYAGAIGYFSEDVMDCCIALRTALIKDNKLYVQAGGGVVADSDPEFEYQETCNKAQAILHAARMTLDKFQ